MPHHVYINHVRREHALQLQYIVNVLAASWDKDEEQAFVFLRFIFFPSQNANIFELAVRPSKSRGSNKQTKQRITHLYWISSSSDYLLDLFSLPSAVGGLVASYGAPLHTVTERSVLGCIRMAMEKHHPHRLWVMQQTHVCITQNNCIASISKNLVMPFSPFSLTLVSFPPTVKDTNKKTNKAQASETVTPELLITKWY